MGTKNAAVAKPFLQLREKRKFNWLVLAMLFAVVIVGAASFLM
jgi:hypothetical protein